MAEDNAEHKESRKAGKKVLFSLLLFFVVFATVDAFYVYSALSTHSGVVDEHSYQTGLKFNDTLKQAKVQKNMDVIAKPVYRDGVLQFSLTDKDEQPLQGVIVKATVMRSTNDAYDFETVLPYKGQGIYKTGLDLPLNGLWQAQIEAKWNTDNQPQIYQSVLEFVYP